MKRKSIPGFVMGLISGIVMGFISFYLIIVFGIVDSVAAANAQVTHYSLLGYSNMVGAIMAILGAALCFKRARVGGIIMLIGSAFMLAVPVYGFASDSPVAPFIGLVIIPIVILVIAAICALTAKARNPKLAHTASAYVGESQAKFCEHCGSALSNGKCNNCGAQYK